MKFSLDKKLAELERMTVGQLHERYAELFGEPVRSRHKQYLIRRIAWRLQANAEGGLSERALRRAEELANIADTRVTPPRSGGARGRSGMVGSPAAPAARDSRLPPPGMAITRPYKGRILSVTVLPDGFEYEGERYKSLTAVAKAITGSHMNGFRFFELGSRS